MKDLQFEVNWIIFRSYYDFVINKGEFYYFIFDRANKPKSTIKLYVGKANKLLCEPLSDRYWNISQRNLAHKLNFDDNHSNQVKNNGEYQSWVSRADRWLWINKQNETL